MKKVYFLLAFLSFLILNAQELKFENGMWEWVVGSKITDKRLNEIAPHFPKPEQYNFDKKLYEDAIYYWQHMYCFEYENFVNAPELTALNPYYTGYVDIVQLPYFLGPLENYDKPLKENFEDNLSYEFALQNWYFVFHPTDFHRLYKMKIDWPEWFSADEYRAKIIKKIEDNKNTSNNNSNQ